MHINEITLLLHFLFFQKEKEKRHLLPFKCHVIACHVIHQISLLIYFSGRVFFFCLEKFGRETN